MAQHLDGLLSQSHQPNHLLFVCKSRSFLRILYINYVSSFYINSLISFN
nr:MAG TPA: hypothetical protein [Caudoviricetes sp.]